jgi:PhnB protein
VHTDPNVQSFKGSPLDTNLSEEEKEKLIMHSTLKLNGGKCTLMASDCGSHSTPVKPGTNVALSVLFTAEPALNLAYDEVSATGKVVEPLKKMFWGALFGHSVDKHGLVWYFVGPHATCVKDEDGKDKA